MPRGVLLTRRGASFLWVDFCTVQGVARMKMRRASPMNMYSWITRWKHRLSDTWTVLTFGLPRPTLSTCVTVGPTVLNIQQWSGRTVGSGGVLWGASRRLIQYMEAHGDGCPATLDSESQTSRPLNGLRLIEVCPPLATLCATRCLKVTAALALLRARTHASLQSSHFPTPPLHSSAAAPAVLASLQQRSGRT